MKLIKVFFFIHRDSVKPPGVKFHQIRRHRGQRPKVKRHRGQRPKVKRHRCQRPKVKRHRGQLPKVKRHRGQHLRSNDIEPKTQGQTK